MKKTNISLWIGSLILILILLLSLFPEMFASQSPYTIQQIRFLHENGDFEVERAPYEPDESFILGSDYFGRDIYSYIIYGTKMTMTLGILIAIGQFLIAVPLALIAGFGNRFVKSIIQQFNVIFSAIPALLIAIILLKLDYFTSLEKEKSIWAFVVVLSVVSWAKLGSLILERVEAIILQPFIKSEVAIGKKSFKIALENVMPHLAPEMFVLFFMEIARSLSMLMQLGIFSVFVGNLGVINDFSGGVAVNLDLSYEPEWASMLSTSRNLIGSAPWAVIVPALAFFISVLGFNLFGEGLRRLMQRKDSTAVLVFRKILMFDFKYLWSHFNKYTKIKIAFTIAFFVIAIASFSALNYKSYDINYDRNIYELPKQVVIGTDEANDTAQLIVSKMKSLGLEPLGENGYLSPYNIGSAYLVESQSLEIKTDSGLEAFKPGKDYGFLTSGNINTSGIIYDASKDDLFNLDEYNHMKNKYILIDKTYYSDQSVEYFINTISKNVSVKGFLIVADRNENISNNIVKTNDSMVIVKISQDFFEFLKNTKNPEIFIETRVKPLDQTGYNILAIKKGDDPFIGEEAIIIGMNYNYLGTDDPSVLAFNLELMKEMCHLSANKRSLIFVFLDGTINEKQHGIHSLAKDFPYNSQNIQAYLDLTGLSAETFDKIEFSAVQAPATRQLAWSLGHQLTERFEKNDYEIKALEAKFIDGSYYFIENPSDNALFWNRGMPTIILGTQETDGDKYNLKALGKIILEVINQNNY